MRKIAIAQAHERLAKAKIALGQMNAAKTYAAFEGAWSDFLIASGGVFSKLEKESKGCGQSEGWFGRKKHDRKVDELLSYVHHARNTEEHGLERTTEHRQSMSIGGNGYLRNLEIDGEGRLAKFDADSGVKLTFESRAVLTPVTDDRFGDTFQVPKSHLSAVVTDASPASVATLAATYLEGLLAEAAQLPQRP